MLSTMTPDLRASSPIPTLGSYVQTLSHVQHHHLSSTFTRTQVHEPKQRVSLSDFHVFMGLLMSVVGAGMLSVPYTFVIVPTAQAVIGIVVVGISMGATANALLHAHVQVASEEELRMRHVGAGKRVASFQSLAAKAGGNVFGYIVSAVTALGIFGGCVGCIRIVRDMTPFMVVLMYSLINNGSVDIHTAIPASDQKAAEQILLWGLFAVVVFPLCLLKNLSALKITNYLGFLFSIYLVIVITYRSTQSVQQHDPEDVHNDTIALNATTTANAFVVPPRGSVREAPPAIGFVHSTASFTRRRLRSEHDTAQDPLEAPAMEREAPSPSASHGSLFSRFAQSVSIYNFAFMMHLNLLPIFIQLRGSFDRPMTETRMRMTKGIIVVTLFCIALYLVFGLCGAKLYGESINGNVLLNLENDSAMKIPLVAVYLTVIVTFPLLFHPMRSVVEELLQQRNQVDTITNARSTTATTAVALPSRFPKQRVVLTTALLGAALLVATHVPRIEIVFALVGATTCTTICFVFPVVIFTRVYPWQKNARGRAQVAALWLIVAFEVVMGGAAVIFVLTSR
uniref:Amino acid transporter transmembrane domain-containing protein n=1 Tax=Globisporangium ultimum (strain ATCC 200006 / CBS 805.95 / DAOM BR144) TaxID=431595 RepID=K3WY93_GLOUD